MYLSTPWLLTSILQRTSVVRKPTGSLAEFESITSKTISYLPGLVFVLVAICTRPLTGSIEIQS